MLLQVSALRQVLILCFDKYFTKKNKEPKEAFQISLENPWRPMEPQINFISLTHLLINRCKSQLIKVGPQCPHMWTFICLVMNE